MTKTSYLLSSVYNKLRRYGDVEIDNAVDQLLSVGGTGVLVDSFAKATINWRDLILRGEQFDQDSFVVDEERSDVRPAKCAVELYKTDKSGFDIVTGFFLNEDKVWICHAWCQSKEYKLNITSCPLMQAYFGYPLADPSNPMYNKAIIRNFCYFHG